MRITSKVLRYSLPGAVMGAAGLLFGVYASAAAGVSTGFAYSGVLRNGGVAETGPHTFVFSLVDGAGASLGCASDTRAALPVSQGRFDVPDLFAACTLLPDILAANPSAKVRVTVDGQALAPDQSLGAVPYAVHAQFADNAPPAPAPVIARFTSTSIGAASGVRTVPLVATTYNTGGYSLSGNTVTIAAAGYYRIWGYMPYDIVDDTTNRLHTLWLKNGGATVSILDTWYGVPMIGGTYANDTTALKGHYTGYFNAGAALTLSTDAVSTGSSTYNGNVAFEIQKL